MNIKVEVCGRFELEKAVCNHGFFMMAPNRWNPSTKTLVRPLRLHPASDHMIKPSVSVTVSISQPSPTFLSITLLDHHANVILPSHREAIVDQVKRMLRLSRKDEEHMKEFHRLHVTAAKNGFGRLFRNPCLFEDIVKTWLLCGCRFKDSLEMAEGLCMVQKRLSMKRKRGRRRRREEEEEEAWGNFPSAAELAGLDRKTLLGMKCNLGYRDGDILEFSKDVRDGKISLVEFENISDGGELYSKLNKIKGIGDFVSCNILMCMGFYHRLPIDSETLRHIKQVHRKDDCKMRNAKKMVEEIYDKYAPFQTLAYWLELVEYYEYHLGKLSLLDSRDYKRVAGTTINRLIK